VKTTLSLLLFAAFTLLVLGKTLLVAQSVPPLINYQGRLTDSTGAPLTNGNYRVAFRLWNKQALDAGQQLVWGREYDVTVIEGGAFSVILGSGGLAVTNNPPPAVNDLAFAFGVSNRFLGLTITRDRNGQVVANPSEILPRQQILSTPFAIRAQESERAQVSLALVPDLANALCPPGSIMAFAGTTVPMGWLLCDGSEISRSTYSNLFLAIGTAWGAGNGSSTFNAPELRGYFLRGYSGTSTNDPDRNARTSLLAGGQTGNAVGSYQQDEFRNHQHMTSGYHPPSPWGTEPNSGGSMASYTGAAAHPSGALTKPVGGAETRPRNAYVNYIIKY
jgi:microcystin-dependent protein